MTKARVYFIDMHASPKQNLLQKFNKLLIKSGIKDIDFNKKLVALKIHFGEPGNLSYIRPNYVKVVADLINENNGLPYLTDCNTLYKGKRSNAVDHLQSAYQNGFNPFATGCHVVIADGIKGHNYREIEINQKNCRTAKIGAAITDSDVIISINHFKGHEMSGFGGAIKNIGMGSGSVGGKLEMHSDSKPIINRENCTGCNLCVENCAYEAIQLDDDNIASINYDVCTGCGQCIAVCMYDAPQPKLNAQNMQEKMVEYAFAVLKNKASFHINFITQVSPYCDCWNYNDIPIVNDIGILASSDPVAIDRASADLVNAAPLVPQSLIGHMKEVKDKFSAIFPSTDWKIGLNYAEQLGLGIQEYELIKIE